MERSAQGQSSQTAQALYITLILDESGSMQSCKGAALAGFNHYLATLKQEPAETRFPSPSSIPEKPKCGTGLCRFQPSTIWM